jgi:hypothetical protein
MADMVVFVVRAGVSPSGAVIRCMQELSGVGGIIFNRVSQTGFQRYYYYGAYSYDPYVSTEASGDQVESSGSTKRSA